MKTFAMVTFGCKVNQYESQALRERFERRGLREVDPAAGADVVVVNTCTVTETAVAEARRTVRRIARRHPWTELTVTGCAAVSHRDDFLEIPGVRRVVPNDAKALLDDDRLAAADTEPSIFDLSISRFDGHTRAFLKVEDGCDLNCSFCIIPRVRGNPVSRPVDAAVDEARRLVESGHREVVLTGVHLGAYGKDLAKRSLLVDLCARLLQIPGLDRLRLSSIEANEVDDELLALMAADRRFCPHLHLPLQSGDDAVLRAMRRRYNVRQFLETCDRARAALGEPGLTGDVIVGFPGETEEQFARTLETCRRAGFHRIHIFPYSRRSGTDAALLPDLPAGVKKARLHRLEETAAELTAAYAGRFVGRRVEVLVEDAGTGYTEHYLKARVGGRAGDLVAATVERVERGTLIAQGR